MGESWDGASERVDLEQLHEVGEMLPILRPFVRLIEYRENTQRLVDLATFGAEVVAVDLPRLARFVPGTDTPNFEAHAAALDKMSRLAQTEIEGDFPMLRGHAVVGLWGAFEAFHDDLLTEWVLLRPAALLTSRLMRVSVVVGEYEALGERERARYLLSRLRSELRSDMRPGVGQFVPLLNELGIHGSMDDGCRRTILELQQVRHVWTHNGGLVDAEFLSRCPWRGDLSLGDLLHVTHEDWSRFLHGLNAYSTSVLHWLKEKQEVQDAKVGSISPSEP